MTFLYEKITRPLLFRLDAETAHNLGMRALATGWAGKHSYSDPILQTSVFGLEFANPLGMAAGFDKNARVPNRFADIGFGFVEVGTVTLRPQPGNPKPRMFRLREDGALINRLGFNNDGAEAVAERLGRVDKRCVIGVNIGKNKDVPNNEAIENYLECFRIVHGVADYVAVNISSPNTPGLRELQQADQLEELLGALTNENKSLGEKPLLVKIAPDLSDQEIEAAAEICTTTGISGVIATNTTVGRVGLKSPGVDAIGDGGLSGRPLSRRSSEVIAQLYRYTAGRVPIIGVGGIFNGQDAFEKIAAGASLVQAYTGFIFNGPGVAADVNRTLAETLRENGYSSVSEAVGSANRGAVPGASVN